MNRECGRIICQSLPLLYLRVPLERVHCMHRRLIVQRTKPIGSKLGGCLISWCIIRGCLLSQFGTVATLSWQLQGTLLRLQGSQVGFQELSDYRCYCNFDCSNHFSQLFFRCFKIKQKQLNCSNYCGT